MTAEPGSIPPAAPAGAGSIPPATPAGAGPIPPATRADEGRATPWWASREDPATASTQDPLAAHRQARRGERHHAEPDGQAADGPTDPGAPWWDGAVTGLARMIEQLSAGVHAQAVANAHRNGATHDGAGHDDEARGASEPDTDQGSGGAGHAGHGHARDAACQICPICGALRAVGERRPELLGHLAEAAHSLSLAARTVLDGNADASGPTRTGDRFEHIDVQ